MKPLWIFCLIALCAASHAATAGCPAGPVAWAPEVSPFYLTVGPSGSVYVTDPDAHAVIVHSSAGAVLATWSAPAGASGAFLPEGVAVDGAGTTYVSDAQNTRIVVLDAGGHYVRSIANPGTGAGQFLIPLDLALGPADDLFVVDAIPGNGKVVHMKRDGTYLNEWPVVVDNGSYDIAVDGDGTVYGAQWPGEAPVEVRSSTGALLRTWSPASAGESVSIARLEAAGGRVFVSLARIAAGGPYTELRTFDGFGGLQCTIGVPYLGAIAFDPGGHLYVGSPDQHEVFQLAADPTPTLTLSWGALKQRYR
jgi:hypothetical protein